MQKFILKNSYNAINDEYYSDSPASVLERTKKASDMMPHEFVNLCTAITNIMGGAFNPCVHSLDGAFSDTRNGGNPELKAALELRATQEDFCGVSEETWEFFMCVENRERLFAKFPNAGFTDQEIDMVLHSPRHNPDSLMPLSYSDFLQLISE